MAEDKRGRFWIATSDHVLRVPRDKLLSGVVTAADVREYGQADGIESTEGVKRSRSVVSDSAGRIWFSLSSGLSVVNPSQIKDDSVPAMPHIEVITADNNTADLAASVRIGPSPRRIAFEYTGLSLAAPGRIRFRYFLENFDSGWSQPVAAREAVYTNLGPGSYRFRLVASNSEGLWNGPETAIALNVAPAYYQTYWFRLSCVAAFLGVFWMLYQLRIRQLTHQFNVRMEERVGERTRIARELHDTLLQSLHGLMFRFQAARNMFVRRPEEAMEALDGAIRRTEEAIVESRDAIKDLRLERAASSDLAELLTASGRELETSVDANVNRPTFRLIVEGEKRDLSFGIRDEVYRIGRELLRNAFQHAHAHQIEAEIRYDDGALTLLVRDDGNGIDPKVLKEAGAPGHWGLPGIRERAKQIRAQIDFWSQNRAGTEVRLTVPGKVAYKASAHQVGFKLFRREKAS
jgi:signal transduction histidine kinase